MKQSAIRPWLVVPSVFASLVHAQQLSNERHRMMPQFPLPKSTAAGDIDGDGDVDLVSLASFQLLVHENDGQGRFVASSSVAAPLAFGPLALGDIDNDGDLDVAIGGGFFFSALPPQLLRNDGSTGFTNVSGQWPTTYEVTRRLLFVDYDGDGDQDIVTCGMFLGSHSPSSFHHLYQNNGAGVFTDITASHLPGSGTWGTSLAAGDVDSDGDVDLLFTSMGAVGSQGRLTVFLQNATGVAVATPGLIPPLSQFHCQDVALVDFELDGDLDIALATDVDVQFWTNNGAGGFSLGASVVDPAVVEWTRADFDGDGRVDLLAARADWYAPSSMKLYRNTVAGFVDATSATVQSPELSPTALLAFDADRDGDVDVRGELRPQSTLWHNDGFGRLLQLCTDDLSVDAVVVAAAADADGDGDIDIAGIERNRHDWTRLFFARNDGRGPVADKVLLTAFNVPASYSFPKCLAWIDADNDGDQDLFVGFGIAGPGMLEPDRLYHSVGGALVDVTATFMPVQFGTQRLSIGDFDNDGVQDIATPYYLYRGTGTGGFASAAAAVPAPTSSADDVAFVDFDGDGDLDLVRAHPSGSPRLSFLRNDWPLPFTDVSGAVPFSTISAKWLGTMDIDRDGRRDLLVAPTSGTAVLHCLRATASGLVDDTATRVPPLSFYWQSFDVIDIDGDGWDDIAFRTSAASQGENLRNANGVLQVGAMVGPLPDRTAAADFDGDGDQDLVDVHGLLRNRERDLQVVVPPRLGKNAEIVVHAYGGDGTNPQFIGLLLSPQLASPAVAVPPFGTLFLDPSLVAYHSTVVIPGTGGETSIAWAVPSIPSLLGTVVHAQCACLHRPNPASWRLGNRIALQIRT